MIDNTWAFDLPDKVFTIAQTRGQAILEDYYPDTAWTKDGFKNEKPTFPNIMFTFTMSERGSDLLGEDINGVMLNVQVDITVLKEQTANAVTYISGVVVTEMKRLHFYIEELPFENESTDDLIRYTFRCQRMIGQADTL